MYKLLIKKLIFPYPTAFFIRKVSDCRRGTSCTSTGEVRITAFTLAEVLITLGVIGVVAAITLPTVINKINDHNFKVAYKKAYRDVNEAYRMMKATDDEFTEISCTSNSSCPSCCFDSNFENNFKLLAKQFKAIKTCTTYNKYKCLKCDDKSSHECRLDAGFTFIDNSGRVWSMYNSIEGTFYVDINGDKSPNLIGKDRWGFYLPRPDQSKTNKNLIVPTSDRDITTKSYTCPSGDCKYKSWLIE